jgi:hypothetical protein
MGLAGAFNSAPTLYCIGRLNQSNIFFRHRQAPWVWKYFWGLGKQDSVPCGEKEELMLPFV